MFVTLLQQLRPIRGLPIWARYGLTALIVLFCFGLRYALEGVDDRENLPLFLMFVPAVILSAFLFDRGSGFFAVALSSAIGLYFFVPPEESFVLGNLGEVVRLLVFVATGLVSASIIEALRHTVDGLDRSNEDLRAANSALDAARREVSDSLALLDRIIESTPDPIFVKDLDGRLVHVNTAMADVLGLPKHVVLGRRDRDLLSPEVADAIEAVDRRVMGAGRPEVVEEAVGRPGEPPRIYLSAKTPWFDPTGRVQGLIGNARDITERKAAEERLRRADARSRLLLDDINHRVKNHLQAVAGLLDRTRRRARSLEDAQAGLEAGAARLFVLGRVYDRLHTNGSATAVDGRSFLQALCDDLRPTLVGEEPVALIVRAEAVELGPTLAVNIGLIVNELVTNALKHAFPSGRTGRIAVTLALKGGDLELEVADDGVGLGAGVREGSSGRRLVTALAAQLGGTVDWEEDGGTRARVRLPMVP